MARPVEDIARPPGLHDAARVHDGDPVAELGHDAEVVGDEDHREAGLALDVLQEAQVLRLDRHVEGGRRLVGDQQARLARDGDGAGNALADPAAHLVRVGVHAPLGIADPHLVQELDDAPVERAAAEPTVERQRLRDLIAHGQRRVERGHRVLQDHRDARPAQFAHLRAALREQILALEQDLPPDDAPARLRHQPQDRQTRHRLPRPRLPDDPERLPATHGEARPVDRLHHPAPSVKMRAQLPHLEQRVSHGVAHAAG
jgi:hypothetical protein